MQIFKNIQLQQLINLLLLIYLAFVNGTLQATPLMVVAIVVYAATLELTIKQELYIPYSAMITALGVVLMLGWSAWYIPFVAIFAAIAQKRWLLLGRVHPFNPSNFALIFALALFYPRALPIVGELGREAIALWVVLAIGSIILIRANRVAISLSFFVSYLLLSYLIIGQSDPAWSLEHFIDSLYSSSFIVYIFFMLTDPITTPQKLSAQIVFGVAVAAFDIVLNYIIGVRLWHMFIALFLVTLFALPLYRKFSVKDWRKFRIIVLLALTLTVIITLRKPLYFSM